MMIDLNDTDGPELPQYDLDYLSQRLAERAPQWVPEYFPRGRIDNRGDTLRLANIRGAPPRKEGSCVITLKGEHAGDWYDHSAGDGGGPLSTLAQATGLRGVELFERATEIIGGDKPRTALIESPRRTDDDRARDIAFIMSKCVVAAGSPVETYLQSRGLRISTDVSDLRYHPDLTDWEAKIGRPAMVAIIRDPVTGAETGGIHRTYLADDGSAKADMTKAKMMLGPSKGVVTLMPPAANGTLGVGEGIETSIAASMIFGIQTWAALSAGNMRHMALPPGLKKLVIFADKGQDGEASAAALSDRAKAAGIDATVLLPRSDDDFAKDLELGLWATPELPPAAMALAAAKIAATAELPSPAPVEPEFLPLNPTVEDLMVAAARLTDTSPNLHKVLRACSVLDPVTRDPLVKAIKKSTRIGLTAISNMIKQYRKEEIPKKRMKPSWVGKMEVFESGEPKPIMLNVATALREDEAWWGVIGFNEFSEQVCMLRSAPFDAMPGGAFPRPWNDDDDLRLTEWLQKAGLHVGREVVVQAIPVVARENTFHPVREWLDNLAWDGIERLDFWLQGHLGAADSSYTRAVASRFMISAVARVHHPGCKADCALILEGAQGLGKSTALRVLFDPWFTDEIADMGSKDTAMQMRGVWGIELAELDAMDRTDVRRIKAFISRTNDRYRPPYGRNIIDVPRQCVFCGSINDSGYLRDPTGGRRFWPVKCGRIDLVGLCEIREQLWAEATARYHAGEMWFLHENELIEAATEEQADRYEGDVWDPEIAAYLGSRFPPNVWRTEHDEITTGEILASALNIDKSKWTLKEQHRVGKYMRFNNWDRIQKRIPGQRGRHWVWQRKMDA